MTDLISPVAVVAYPVVKRTLDGLATTVRKAAGAIAKHAIDKAIANFQIGFVPYLNTSYERCKSVKTLLSQDRPLALLDIYVHLFLDCDNTKLIDDDLIYNLESYRRMVITGLAGSGKSMFMKYLTICRFENSRGRIPLFVELRQLNALTSKNLLAYIHQSCASAGNSVTYDQFELALRAGGIVLILDGFDEIDFAHRDAISKQILEVSVNYPHVTIILSSRPDDKFASWQDFYTFTVRALDKDQVLELIDKINYDEGLKGRFKREVDRRLYKSHNSFLSSPLLSSIMLLTYEYFAEIPNKIHIFYEQAFAALFRRHDAQKSQFIRKTYANLALDDFRNFFGTFCAFSYLEERFTFLEGDLRRLITQALRYAVVKAKIDDVLRDLHECVCMLQKDGIHTIFVHRLFQEYFCAVFMANYHGPQAQPILDKCARRSQDEVIPMLFEMARERIDRDWALPHIDEVVGAKDSAEHAEVSARIFGQVIDFAEVAVHWYEAGKVQAHPATLTAGQGFFAISLICKLYSQIGSEDLVEIFYIKGLVEAIARVCKRDVRSEEDVEEFLPCFGTLKKVGNQGETGSRWILRIDITRAVIERLELITVGTEFAERLRSIRMAIKKRIGDQDSIVELLCQEAGPLPKPRARRGRALKAP